MTYKKNEAYDLSLFEEKAPYNHGSAAPQRETEPRRAAETQEKKGKILSIPEKELIKIRKRNHNPAKLTAFGICCMLVAAVVGIIIVGQVRINELNDSIITAESTLAQAQSIYTETELKVSADLSDTAIEDYAENVLGMTKASDTQKEFVSLSDGDKVEVSAQSDENIFTRFWDSVTSLWS